MLMLKYAKNTPKYLHNSSRPTTFAPVFHGIRFKVRRLFVVTTSNFFYFKQFRS